MLQKYNILQALHNSYLIAVIRGSNEQEAKKIAYNAYEGGINILEIAFSTPNAEQVIAELSQKKDEKMIIGAGTVLDKETARIAIMKGANFIVSPHFDSEIAKVSNLYSIPYFPGCSSAREIIDAISYGVDIVKLFPSNLLKPDFIKDIKGPIPHAQLMPSGGVDLDNIDKWIMAGSFAIGLGGALTRNVINKDYCSVKKEAQKFVEKVHDKMRENNN